MTNKIKFKHSTVTSALLLAASPALANTKLGGQQPQADDETHPPPNQETRTSKPTTSPGKNYGPQSQLRIESITVDKAYKYKVTTCTTPIIKKKSPRPRNILSLAFDINKRHVIRLPFEMSNIAPSKDEHVLLLLYGRCLTTNPTIKTPLSKNKLALDVKDIEILGTYNISPTSSAGNTTSTAMTIEVDLELDKLASQVDAGNDTFYFQAALMKKTDFDRKSYGVARLSPLEAIHVTKRACPSKNKFEDDFNSVNESCQKLPSKTE